MKSRSVILRVETCFGSSARQHDPEFNELPKLRLHIDAAAMLADDDVVAHRETKPGTFARRFSPEERIEYLLFYPVRDSGPIVTDANFDLVAEIPRRRCQRRSNPSPASVLRLVAA
jgi:hypothetical protein